MLIEAYVILEPGADRPYFCNHIPETYVASRPGARVFSFRLEVPGFESIRGIIQLTPTDIIELTERKMVPELVEDKEFTCPRCGSHMFGSFDARASGIVRYCHGNNCQFSFPITDDALYFKGTGHFSPRLVIGTISGAT